MNCLEPITDERMKEASYFLYIHTPFCGTCHIARSMLTQIELAHDKCIFYEMNASFYPQFMQDNKIESVPCLLIKKNNEIKERVYAFKSIPNIYRYLISYQPELF